MSLPGGGELIIILLIFVLLFGAAKLPALGRSMGQSISFFKKGVEEGKAEEKDEAAQLQAQATEAQAKAAELQAQAEAARHSVNGSTASSRQHQ